jgi:hypothetical protein
MASTARPPHSAAQSEPQAMVYPAQRRNVPSRWLPPQGKTVNQKINSFRFLGFLKFTLKTPLIVSKI